MTENKYNEALGIGLSLLFESQTFPFLLSSAFTARTIVQDKDQQEEVIIDAWVAVGISIAFTVIMSYFLHSTLTLIVGTIFAFVFFSIYMIRGELW